MDALSELLRVIKLDSALFFHAEMSEPWCLSSPESCTLREVLAPEAPHLIIFHFLICGRGYVELAGRRVELEPGDVVTFPQGDAHRLGNGVAPPVEVSLTLREVVERGLAPLRLGGGGAETRFVCGYLACDSELGRSPLAGLPALVRVNLRDDSSGQWLENSIEFAVRQAVAREAGTRATLAKLSEVLFGETLRRYVRELPEEEIGWFAAARDPAIGKVLTSLHQRPDHPWTLGELAKQAGVSRTVLVERFRHYLDAPPMAYLTNWRLRLGARALLATSHSVATIARDVGYESEASFNRAFKREYGVPPARYRRERLAREAASATAPGVVRTEA